MLPADRLVPWSRLASSGVAMLLLAGCSSLGLDYARPEMQLRAAYADPQQSGVTVDADTRWWTAFGDKQLTALIEAGLAQNLSVLQAIERVNRELGTTTVVITHNAVIAGMADRVIRLSDGRIVSQERNAHREPASGLQW